MNKIIAALASVLTFPAALDGQTIGVSYNRIEDSIHIDVATIPTQQFWLTESGNLADWTNHTFVGRSTTLNLGPPVAGPHFFGLHPLYGQLTWTPTNNMPVARDQFTGGVINGKLYVFGGNGDNPTGINLSRLDIYDLNTGEWTSGAPYAVGIEELSSAVVGERLYVFGGYAGGPVRINLCYDPATDTWSETAPKPTQIQATTAVAWGDEILTVGGSDGEDVEPSTVVEAYHTVSNTWRVVTDLPDHSVRFGAGIHENVLYLVGGAIRESITLLNKVRRFDLTNGMWLPEIDGILPHPVIAVFSSACPIVNGKLIIGGGLTTRDGGFTVTNLNADIIRSDVVTVYDIQSNTITTNTPLPEVFDDHLFLLAEDKIFALGGRVGPFGTEEPTSRMLIGAFQK